jgi:hypothetical protein
MTAIHYTRVLIVFFSLIILIAGCDKQKIVESTEYVHDIKYIESPPDTIFHLDTLYIPDSIEVHATDTIRLIDTVTQITEIHDTVRINVIIHDTVVTIHDHYDTITVTDTVFQTQYQASAPAAVEAMQYYSNSIVLDYVYQQFGLGDGWVFYLASSQMDISHPSANVYDIYGYLEYYSADWVDYYPFEFYWRLTYKSGDPAIPTNWQISDPPSAVAGHQPGVRTLPREMLVRPVH